MAKIIKTYVEEVPALRFIGKKHDSVSAWNDWFKNGWFEKIEELTKDNSISNIYKDADAYIGLIRCSENKFEYWIGMFVAKDIIVPDGFIGIDFPKSKLGVCWIYGKEKETYMFEGECFKEIEKTMEIINDNGKIWSIERYVCPRFTNPDENGNIILDYCFLVK